MPLKFLALTIAIIFAFASSSAWSVSNDGSGPASDDLKAACSASLQACDAACKRENTPSGVLQESFCKDDCFDTYYSCIRSIPQQKPKTRGKNQKKKTLGN